MLISLIETIKEQLPRLVDQFEHSARVENANFEEIQDMDSLAGERSYVEVTLPSSAKDSDGDDYYFYFMRFNLQGCLLCALYGTNADQAVLIPVIVYAKGVTKVVHPDDAAAAQA